MEAKTFRGVAGAVDPPAAALENSLDVRALDRVEMIRRALRGRDPLGQRQRRVEL